MLGRMPEVTVVVPARNAAATIGRTIDALLGQDFEGSSEIVVVDDASTDETAAIAAARGLEPLSLEAQTGPSGARNAGVAAGSGRLLAFTDADCVPAPEWLRAGVEALRGGSDLVTGETLPDPEAVEGPFDRTLRITGPSPLFESANLFATRELFERVGGFARPEQIPLAVERGHFGEDAVFGWRALRAGADRRFAAEATVFHAVFPRGPRGFIDERRRLRLFPWLLRDVPELRAELPLRLFLSARTARFDLALAGVLAAAVSRRRWPLLLALPYLRSDLPYPPYRRSGLRRNLAFLAADAVGLAALLRGSAETRSPLI